MIQERFGEAARVGLIAGLANGLATCTVIQEGRMSPVEFGIGVFVVFLFTTAAWFTLLSFRQRRR